MIYADNAATTRISDIAFQKMLPFLQEHYGNASSSHFLGGIAKRAIELARNQIAMALGATSSEIIFASSGSEANNWVLRSVVDAYSDETPHIITSAIEHSSVLQTCRELEKTGVDVTYLPVNMLGRISIDDVWSAIKPTTKLVSLMYVNNEIGTIQPIAKIGALLRKKNILFHTDAVQAFGHIPTKVDSLQVDYLTASAHKFNGSKGTGILYKSSKARISPMLFGGGQERELRAGTEYIAGIVAAGYAIEENLATMDETTYRINTMVNDTVKCIQARIPALRVNGDFENRIPGIINLGFEGVSGESLMHLLDLQGICVSTSSACFVGRDEPSHVLLALGLTKKQAKSAIRISFGRYNTPDEVDTIVSAICNAYGKILDNQRK